MTARPLGVGLLGLGTVGSAVARAFAERSRRIDAAAGRPLALVAAVVRDPSRARDGSTASIRSAKRVRRRVSAPVPHPASSTTRGATTSRSSTSKTSSG